MDGIKRITNRIMAIDNRFGLMPQSHQTEFADFLTQAQMRQARNKKVDIDAGRLTDIIRFSAKRHGVDEKLALAVAKVESDLKPGAVSEAGAIGVMQLMPETAGELGVRDIYDVRENIDGGVRYLRKMLSLFQGDIAKAVAAYNAGPQAVETYNGVPPYSETKMYVNKVLALYNS